ncbi:phosphohydrolase [bacterium]|nr:MAG: phosphohydrolase [bacterium]
MEQRQGDWIETFMGVKFFPLDPRPEEVILQDIAHALSHICRYTGHCSVFYSVAQHSLAIMKELKKLNYSPRIQLIGLLHDASEAYLCDVPRPLKPFLPGYKEWENKIMDVIWQAFQIEPPTTWEWGLIKSHDDKMLANEGNILMNNLDGWTNRLPLGFRNWQLDWDRTPTDVKKEFISSAYELLRQIDS